jgi:Cu/Ag efflux pump CusA
MSNKLGTLGLSGGLAKRFQDNALTPLLAVAALLLGAFAVVITPREEEPQIDVTLANVFVAFPGASTTEVENLVSIPMEQVLAEIDGVKHVYSVSRPGCDLFEPGLATPGTRHSAAARQTEGY